MDNNNDFLIHVLKTIEYRFKIATAQNNPDFGDFKITTHTRSPKQIVNHMFELIDKTKRKIQIGDFKSPSPELLDFEGESKRFISGIHQLIRVLEEHSLDPEESKRLLQGPILDASTHVGQISMLNGIHGKPTPYESYYVAPIE